MGVFATSIGAPEGPICLEDGSMYVTEMSADTLRVTRIAERSISSATRGATSFFQ